MKSIGRRSSTRDWSNEAPALWAQGTTLGRAICVPTAIPRSSFVVRCGFDLAVSSYEGRWVPNAKETGLHGGAKFARTSCWLKQLSSMAGRSGTNASFPKPTCGQVPSVEDAKPTFQRECTESICRPCPGETGTVGRLRRLRFMRKTKCWRTKPSGREKQNCESCVTKLRRWRTHGKGQPAVRGAQEDAKTR